MLSNKNILQHTYVILNFLIAEFLERKGKGEINSNNIFYLTKKIKNKIF